MKLIILVRIAIVIGCYFFLPIQSIHAQQSITDCYLNDPDGLNSRSECVVNDQPFGSPVDQVFIDILYDEGYADCGSNISYAAPWSWNPNAVAFTHSTSPPYGQFYVGVLHYWLCSYYDYNLQTYVYDRITRNNVNIGGHFYYNLVGDPTQIFYSSHTAGATTMTY